MKLNRKVKRNKGDCEINGAETLRNAMYAKYSGGGKYARTRGTHYSLPPSPHLQNTFLYKELFDSPSIPYPVTGKYSILREVHRQYNTATLYQSLMLLLLCTDVSVKPGGYST
jgi:hypothetical protein